jgi:hypothetical protein
MVIGHAVVADVIHAEAPLMSLRWLIRSRKAECYLARLLMPHKKITGQHNKGHGGTRMGGMSNGTRNGGTGIYIKELGLWM